jgi:site-specific DNA recombinase
MCREYAQERGYQIVAELHEDDQGASGAILELPQLNQVRDLARAKAFDVLVVRELDRLSRSLPKQLLLEGQFKHQGIKIDYVLGEYPDTAEGSLMKHVKASIAEFERLKIQERMMRGREAQVRAGSVLAGRPPFGYRLVKRGGRTTLEVNEAEAEIVRQIFRWYTEGERPLGTHQIHKRLHQLKVPSPGDLRSEGWPKKRGYGEWHRSTVVRILENETYSGTWHWRKTTNSNGKRIPTEADARIAVDVPAIISSETWEAAEARRSEDKARRRGTTRRRYLLTRRVSCGLCGVSVRARRMSGGLAYYTCPARDKSRTTYSHTCNLPYFRSDALEAAVWAWAKSLLLDPATLETGLAALREQSENERAPLRERIQAIDRQLAAHRQESAQLLDQYLAGRAAKESLQDRKQSLDDRDTELQRERAALLARLETQSLDDSALRDLGSFAEQVLEGLAKGDDEELRRTVIENLDVRVRLTVEGGQKLAEVRCILGSERLVMPSTT